jgi:hypothetical protein
MRDYRNSGTSVTDIVKKVILLYLPPTEISVTHKEIEAKLTVIKNKYLDTALIDNDLAESMKFLIDVYTNGNSDQYLGLTEREEPKEEPKGKLETLWPWIVN